MIVHSKLPLAIKNRDDCTLELWDLTREQASLISSHAFKRRILLAEADEDCFGVVYADSDEEVFGTPCYLQMCSWESFEVASSFKLPEDAPFWLQQLAISPDGQIAALAGIGERLSILDTRNGSEIARIPGGEWTSGLAFDRSSRQLSAAHTFQGGGFISLYDVRGGQVITHCQEIDRTDVDCPNEDFADTFATIKFNKDCNSIAVFETSWVRGEDYSWYGNLYVYDVTLNKTRWSTRLNSWEKSSGMVRPANLYEFWCDIALNSTSSEILVGGPIGELLCYEFGSGQITRKFDLPGRPPIETLVYEPNFNRVWTLDANQEYRPVCIDLG